LILFGTVNVDETTQMFSPKFLDRAYVIRFPPVTLNKRLTDLTRRSSVQEAIWPIPFDHLQTLIANGNGMNQSGVADVWNDFLDWQELVKTPLFARIATILPKLIL
jgi:hypothetical protein